MRTSPQDQLEAQVRTLTASEAALKEDLAKAKSALGTAEPQAAERLKQLTALKAELAALTKQVR